MTKRMPRFGPDGPPERYLLVDSEGACWDRATLMWEARIIARVWRRHRSTGHPYRIYDTTTRRFVK